MLPLTSTTSATSTADKLTATPAFRLGAAIVTFIFLIVYALTLDTGLQPEELVGGDLITHQYAQVEARPGNAPGYPIYTMGGWLWFHLGHYLISLWAGPYPNPMPLLSSYSLLWAILSLILFYAILGQYSTTDRNSWLATGFCILVTCFLGVTYFFWYYATTTEQYSSAIAQSLAIIYLYILWDKQPDRRGLLYALAFLCGLSLAHMLTVVLMVPPLVAVVLWRDRTILRSPSTIILTVLAAILPLVSYLYVYMRGALHPNWWGRGYWPSPQAWFWSFVSTAQGRDELSWAFEPGRPFFGNGFPQGIWLELSIPLMIFGIVGLFLLPRRHSVFLLATLALYIIFCWLYRFGNWFQVILPAYPLILIGLAPVYSWLGNRNGLLGQWSQWLVLALLAVTLWWRVDQSLPAANSRHRPQDTALERAAILLDQPFPQDARLFAALNDTLAIRYLTDIWGIRPDIKMLKSSDADADMSEGDTIFSTVDALPALLAEINVTPTIDGFSPDWLKVSDVTSRATEENISASPVYTISNDLILSDYEATPAPTGAPLSPPDIPGLDVTLTWQLLNGSWPENLSISLRPTYLGQQQVDPETGQPIQQDRPLPLYGLWQTPAILPQPGKVVTIHDPYRLPQPDALPHPADGLLLILYTQTETGFSNIAEISLPLSQPEP